MSVVRTAFDRLGEMMNEFVRTLVRMNPTPSLSFGDWRKHDCDAVIVLGSTIPRIYLVAAGVAEFDGEATKMSNRKDDVFTIAQTTKHLGLHEEGRQGTAGF